MLHTRVVITILAAGSALGTGVFQTTPTPRSQPLREPAREAHHGGAQQQLPVLNGGPCDPAVTSITFGQPGSDVISKRIQVLFDQDQDREASAKQGKPWTTISAEDRGRQQEILGYLGSGQINSAEDLYHAAMIFQHGDCPEHFQLANRLADMAVAKGSDLAKWLYAASLDRYLMSQGKPQKFGTQFFREGATGKWQLYPVDPAITDEERARYHVPALAAQLEKAKNLNTAPKK